MKRKARGNREDCPNLRTETTFSRRGWRGDGWGGLKDVGVDRFQGGEECP